jgi:hypothetical protein
MPIVPPGVLNRLYAGPPWPCSSSEMIDQPTKIFESPRLASQYLLFDPNWMDLNSSKPQITDVGKTIL